MFLDAKIRGYMRCQSLHWEGGKAGSTLHPTYPKQSNCVRRRMYERGVNERLANAHYPSPEKFDDGGTITDKTLAKKAARYVFIANDLYKRGFATSLLKCLGKEQSEYVMNELHNGVCGMHCGHRTLAARVI